MSESVILFIVTVAVMSFIFGINVLLDKRSRAREEKELFKLLFMSDIKGEVSPGTPDFTESVNHAKVVPTSMLKHRISDIRLLNNAFAFLFILSLPFTLRRVSGKVELIKRSSSCLAAR